MNTLINDERKWHPNTVINTIPFSFKFLRSLTEKYLLYEVVEYFYDCPLGEQCNNWMDIEGIDHGWMFLRYPEMEMPKRIFTATIRHLKKSKGVIYKHKIITSENDDYFYLIIPLRNEKKYDIYFTFIKNQSLVERVGRY